MISRCTKVGSFISIYFYKKQKKQQQRRRKSIKAHIRKHSTLRMYIQTVIQLPSNEETYAIESYSPSRCILECSNPQMPEREEKRTKSNQKLESGYFKREKKSFTKACNVLSKTNTYNQAYKPIE